MVNRCGSSQYLRCGEMRAVAEGFNDKPQT
jgi:hypothetical protein